MKEIYNHWLTLLKTLGFNKRGANWSIDQLVEQLRDHELLLLDVRSEKDYQGELGHIANSRNLPLEVLTKHLPGLSGDRERTIALICTTDKRSKRAAKQLRADGFPNIHVVSGGMAEWNRQGLPVEKGGDGDQSDA